MLEKKGNMPAYVYDMHTYLNPKPRTQGLNNLKPHSLKQPYTHKTNLDPQTCLSPSTLNPKPCKNPKLLNPKS